MNKPVIVSLCALALTVLLAATAAAAGYGALGQRVAALENSRITDSEMLRETRDTVIRLCATSPGCKQ